MRSKMCDSETSKCHYYIALFGEIYLHSLNSYGPDIPLTKVLSDIW